MPQKSLSEKIASERRKSRRTRKRKNLEQLEAAIEELDDYTASCSWDTNQAFLLICKWARKGLNLAHKPKF